jgi:hypothetical protein
VVSSRKPTAASLGGAARGGRGVRCYIYGSVHVRVPRGIEKLLNEVECVLLEHVDTSRWRLVVKRDPTALPLSFSILFYFFLLGLCQRKSGGDMDYVNKRAKEMDKCVKFVDAGIDELHEKARWIFTLFSAISLISLVVSPFIIISCALAYAEYGLLPLLGGAVVGVIASISLNLSIILVFAIATMKMRDLKVVEEAYRLITEHGRGVLIVRGERHVKFIAQELRKRGIECETFSWKDSERYTEGGDRGSALRSIHDLPKLLFLLRQRAERARA